MVGTGTENLVLLMSATFKSKERGVSQEDQRAIWPLKLLCSISATVQA